MDEVMASPLLSAFPLTRTHPGPLFHKRTQGYHFWDGPIAIIAHTQQGLAGKHIV